MSNICILGINTKYKSENPECFQRKQIQKQEKVGTRRLALLNWHPVFSKRCIFNFLQAVYLDSTQLRFAGACTYGFLRARKQSVVASLTSFRYYSTICTLVCLINEQGLINAQGGIYHKN